ncbi:glycosyltransferase [Rathayibacter agropyri]|uniref:glycosyltransferase n=1 Tax=Rathayibacter agropyri TaxID=1634927 RepID=UPI001565B571|nr:glycosyltransferase [Rathayibacter agropyri]NRD08062.1 glycosyltransferase family 4 protein [Rathayibacter agropyri]
MKTNQANARSLRIVPELRAVHIERYFETTPAKMIYFKRNYDLEGTTVPPGIEQKNLRDLASLFWNSTAQILEIPEPLWVRFLPTSAVIAFLFKTTGALRSRPRLIATYAMENNDLAKLIGGRRHVPRGVSKAFSLCVGAYMRIFVDRIAFASRGSSDLYTSLPFVRFIDHVTIEELPSPRAEQRDEETRPAAVFVGALEERKGIIPLTDAWEHVEATVPGAVLTIVGPGLLAPRVEQWAHARPSSRRYTGQLAWSEVLEFLPTNRVLVAPSIPEGRWREQIGLPIKEGLSFGLTVVTTQQTGLANWLEDRGHTVIPIDNDPQQFNHLLADALINALDVPLPRVEVRASLPAREGRYEADAWMHRSAQ